MPIAPNLAEADTCPFWPSATGDQRLRRSVPGWVAVHEVLTGRPSTSSTPAQAPPDTPELRHQVAVGQDNVLIVNRPVLSTSVRSAACSKHAQECSPGRHEARPRLPPDGAPLRITTHLESHSTCQTNFPDAGHKNSLSVVNDVWTARRATVGLAQMPAAPALVSRTTLKAWQARPLLTPAPMDPRSTQT